MNKHQTIAALIVVAWAAYHLGKRAAVSTAKPATAVATVDSATWDWLNAVGRM